MKLVVLTPIYNDWTAVAALIAALNDTFASEQMCASILVVNDGSRTQPDLALSSLTLPAIDEVDVLHLRRNLGHQRAIAIGLAYIEANTEHEAVVVMDGDGEDRPEDIPRLLRRLQTDPASPVVFAERTRRSEGIVFATLYWWYRIVHRLLTGERVRVGNFSIIPRAALRSLVSTSDLWNHYAAAVFHARIPFVTVPTTRGSR
jgi:polyisoprenyl-phosphate glycosyltransferase